MLKVNEIFTSLQGEGVHAGKVATFVRLQGCPVGCEWCDTKYAQGAGGAQMEAKEIMSKVHDHATFIVITGGEPLIQNLDELLMLCKGRGMKVQIETSGYCKLKGLVYPDWVTWSPKRELAYGCAPELLPHVKEVKWVVDTHLEYSTIIDAWHYFHRVTGQYPHFVLMPEGCPPSQNMVDKAVEMLYKAPPEVAWRYGDRLQWRLAIK